MGEGDEGRKGYATKVKGNVCSGTMKLKIIFENENLIAADKPAGIDVYSFIGLAVQEFPALKKAGSSPRYGLAHRLDKETSGIILIAKNNKALKFLQKQFAEKKVLKEYLALAVGKIKKEKRQIKTLIGRSGKNRLKQEVVLPLSPLAQNKGKRWAETLFEIKQRFRYYTLLKASPKTGRRHQIRVHLAHINHPVAGDKVYGFKNPACPKGLKRQFLHAAYLKIKMPDGKEKGLKSELPKDLQNILKKLKI